MNLENVKNEVEAEFSKDYQQLAEDIVVEANSGINDLDAIKHLVKRMAVHQVAIEHQARRTNRLILILSAIADVSSIFNVLTYLELI